MLEILITQMRREGFEMTVSPPKVLYQKNEVGEKLEPIEEVTVDLDEEYSSKVIDSMNKIKGNHWEIQGNTLRHVLIMFGYFWVECY